MLVILSDLHLTDGSTCETIGEGAFRVFRQRLGDMAYDASWRASVGKQESKYKPIKELDLVLLGDILDVIRSEKWPLVEPTDTKYVRPWSDQSSPAFKDTVKSITEAIVAKNSESLKILRNLGDAKPVTLPSAENGKPVRNAHKMDDREREQVTVRIHYLVGNHDWFFHLPGPDFDDIRGIVSKAIGLTTPIQKPFPHDPHESEELMKIYEAHEVFARHGDIYDQHNFDGDRNGSSLGDAIVVDLLNRFPVMVKKKMGRDLPKAFLDGLKELDNVRPVTALAGWIDGLLCRTCYREKQTIKGVKKLWNMAVDDFFSKIDFVKEKDTWRPFEVVDQLKAQLRFTKWLSFGGAADVANRINLKATTYRENALAEQAFRNQKARFIVYGHTHHHEIVPLDLTFRDGGRFQQLYINSGTWRPVHDLAVGHPEEHEFVDYKVMTYLAFFKDDERSGQRFESWSGALGVTA